VLALSGEAVQAAAEAEAVAGADAKPGELYDAACVFSQASEATARAKGMPEGERSRLAEQYAGRAVALLRQARQAGFFKDAAAVDLLEKDSDLEPLRSREEYRKLLAELAPPKAPDR
jgi:hypothetical protein